MRYLLITLSLALVILSGLSSASAADPSGSAGGAALSGSTIQLLPSCLTSNPQDAPITCVTDSIVHFTSLLLWLIAISAFLYLLYGAFLYVTAFGDEGKVTTAKGVIRNALIGVVIATLANVAISLLKSALQVP